MKLTEIEKEILQHRIEVPDCIFEVISNDYEDRMIKVSDDEIYDAIESVGVAVNSGEIQDGLSILQADVLTECLEGSTWCATHASALANKEISSAKYYSARRYMIDLAKKISDHVGYEIRRIPLE